MVQRLSTRLGALAFIFMATSCGGGGGDTVATAAPAAPQVPGGVASQPTVEPVPQPVPQPAAPAASQPAVAAGTATCGIPDFASTALARINAARAAGANCRSAGTFPSAAALTWSTQLTQAAAAHTGDMVTNNFFSHTGSSGSSLGTRVTAAGYTWRAVAENIAAGYNSIDSVMAGWLGSDGHCANVMSATYTQVGLACIASSSNGNNWTMDLAAPR